MHTSARTSVASMLAALAVAGLLAGCASATKGGAMAANAGDEQTPAGGERAGHLSRLAQLVEACLHTAVNEDVNLVDVRGLVRACFGATESREARIMASHAAVLLIANYGERSIRVFRSEDPQQARAEASLLKLQVQDAQKELVKLKQTPPSAILASWPTYSAALEVDAPDAMLPGLARAALAPVVRRTKVTVRQYITASAGGAPGVLQRLFERRETAVMKIQFVRETGERAERGLKDARCMVERVDPPAAGHALGDIVGDQNVCATVTTKFGGVGRPGVADAHWNDTEQLLKGTIERLDQIISGSVGPA